MKSETNQKLKVLPLISSVWKPYQNCRLPIDIFL